MQFHHGPEHDRLRDELRRLLDELAGPAAARAQGDGPYEATTVRRLADELGAFGLAVPERYGGAGLGLIELGLVFHEAGRALLRAPLLSTTLASALLFASGDEPMCHRLLPGLADGSVRGAAAVLEDSVGWADVPTTVAVGRGDEWRLTGTKTWVLDGQDATVLVVAAAVEGVPTLFLVEDTDALDVEPLDTVDPTRRVARVHLDGTAGELLGPARHPLAAVADAGRALVAAEQTGIAQRCLETASARIAGHEPLGRSVDAFHTIAPELADVALEVEAALAASQFALWSADHDADELPVAARVAAVTCSDAALLATEQDLQAHGGTVEHPAHLYRRRAMTNRLLFGAEQDDMEFLAYAAAATVPE